MSSTTATPPGASRDQAPSALSGRSWIDGELMDIADARISVTDHGFLYGDGIFEGLRIRSRRIFRLDDHLARFETGARLIGLELPGGRGAQFSKPRAATASPRPTYA